MGSGDNAAVPGLKTSQHSNRRPAMAAFLEKAAEQEEVFRKECLYIRLFPFIKALIANKIARNMANARARSHQEQQPIGLPKSLSVGHLLLDNS
jgi:hypothetical protein